MRLEVGIFCWGQALAEASRVADGFFLTFALINSGDPRQALRRLKSTVTIAYPTIYSTIFSRRIRLSRSIKEGRRNARLAEQPSLPPARPVLF